MLRDRGSCDFPNVTGALGAEIVLVERPEVGVYLGGEYAFVPEAPKRQVEAA